MSAAAQQLRLTAAAAVATGLSTTALLPIFAGPGWWPRALGAVLVVALAGALARSYRWAAGWQLLLTVGVLVEYLCLAFVQSSLVGGLVPGPRAWTALQGLATQGVNDIALLTLPVPTKPGLVLVATAGVGLVALLVDTAAVTFHRAAVSGGALLVLFAVPGAVRAEGIGWLPFALTAAGWLALLLVENRGRTGRWSGSGPAVQRLAGHDAGQARVGRRIGTAALGIAVVVPVLLPGLNARLLPGSEGTGEGLGPRTTTTYNPITRLRADLRLPQPRPVLRYATDDPRPDYLRMTTLDEFTDSGWTASRLSGTPRRDGVDRGLPDPIGLTTAATKPVRTSIRISGLQARWLPVPFPPRAVEVPGPWLYDDVSETVFGIRTDTADVQQDYTVAASRVLPERDALDAAGAAVPEELARYTDQPEMTRAVADLTDRIVRGKVSAYDRVAAIQAFFTDPDSRFVYDTSPTVPGLVGESALEDFLTSRRGFCEQYASAMGAMIRRAGVPARVAVGFTPGTRAPDGTYNVTTDNAHAWPEAWFAGAGWVRFEPTPRDDGQTSVPEYARPPGAAPAAPQPSAAPSQAAPAPGPSSGPTLEDEPLPAASSSGNDEGGPGPLLQMAVVALAVLAIAALLLAVPGLVHRLRRERRWRGAGAAGSSPAGTAWQQLRDDATDVGLPWSTADSPRGAAERIGSAVTLSDPARAALGRLVAATEQARYAPPAAITTGPYERRRALHDDAATVRHGLLAAVGRRARLRAVVLPSSTMGWAVHGLGSGVADLLDRMDDGWTALRRTLTRGRWASQEP